MKGTETPRSSLLFFSSKATWRLARELDILFSGVCSNISTFAPHSDDNNCIWLKNLFSIIDGSCETVSDVVKIIKLFNENAATNQELINEVNALKWFCELYLFCDIKSPCKMLFARLLQNPSWKETDCSHNVDSVFMELFEANSDLDLSEIHVIQTLEHYLKTFNPHITSSVTSQGLRYVVDMLKLHRSDFEDLNISLAESLENCIQKFYTDLKCATVLISRKQTPFFDHNSKGNNLKSNSEAFDSSVLNELKNEVLFVLNQDNFGWECWNAAGYVYCLLTMLQSRTKSVARLEDMLHTDLCNGAFIGLCNGCLMYLNTSVLKRNQLNGSVVQQHVSTNGVHPEDDTSSYDENVFNFITSVFTHLMDLTERIKLVPDQIALAKCVVQWSFAIKNFTNLYHDFDVKIAVSQFKSAQCYATVCLDHPVDVIRHQARDILVNILTICGSSNSSKKLISFTHDLVKNAFSWDWHKRPVYIFLHCSSDFVDIDFILKQDDNLIKKLLVACVSQALAPYASQLYLQYAQKYGKKLSQSKLCDTNQHDCMDYWLRPVLSFMLNCNVHQSRLLVDYTIVKLLKLYRPPSVKYLVACLKEEDEKLSTNKSKSNFLNCLILCLKPAQRLGLMKKTLADTTSSESSYEIDLKLMKSALLHHDNQVRLDAFCLFCESWKPTALISNADLELFQSCLPYNMICQCPAFRQELLNTIKKFLHRLKLNLESLRKGKKGSKSDSEAIISTYTNFELWLFEFCFNNLLNGASYPRKNLALAMLCFVVNNHVDCQKKLSRMTKSFTCSRIEMLVDLLTDDFEDNRQLALEILTKPKLKRHIKKTLRCSYIWNLVESSLKSGRSSCKPETCRDAAFSLRFAAKIDQSVDKNIITMCKYFVSFLRDDVKVANRNLLKAVRTGPMHGCLLCIRLLLSDADTEAASYISSYQRLLTDCINLCYKAASAVFPVVGSESPEGYIPDVHSEMVLPAVHKRRYEKILAVLQEQLNLENEETSQEMYGQSMLVMCWRTAKESYLLLQLIASLAARQRFDDESTALLSWQQFLNIGEHLRNQLMDTVHRGTFEVAYSAFRDYCPLLWRSKDPRLNSHPKKWVYDTVDDICDPEKSKLLCSTRRSAGLPFFLQAILGSDKSQVTRNCLSYVMDSLLPLVNCDLIADLKEPAECSQQIHTFNVLRGLIKDASLAENIMPYLSKCVIISIIGFGSNIWRIRNSSTLLFSALMTRIFGVKKDKDLETSGKNRLSSQEFFTRMPELQEFLLEHLVKNTNGKSEVDSIEQDANLYPVLLLLSRVYPSPSRQQGSTEALAVYQSYLVKCGFSPIYKCRVMAANAVACVTAPEDRLELLTHLLKTLRHDLPANQIHGTLLQVQKLVTALISECKNNDDVETLSFITNLLVEKNEFSTRKIACLVVRSAFLNLCLDISKCCFNDFNRGDGPDMLELSKAIQNLLETLLVETADSFSNSQTTLPGHTMFLESAGKLFAFCWIWDVSTDSVRYPLCCPENSVVSSFLKTLKKYLESVEGSVSWHNTDKALQLEDVLIRLAGTPLDNRCLAKIFTLFSVFVSTSRSLEVLDLARHQVTETFWRDDKLVGAIALCQAVCLKNIATEKNSLSGSSKLFQWLQAWLTILERSCSILRHRVSVRLCVADALRMLAVELMIDVKQNYDTVCTQAWKILFLLLVDEDEAVRKGGSQIVYDVAKACNIITSDELTVDTLAIEVALHCLLSAYSKASVTVQEVLNFISNLTGYEDSKKKNPQDGAQEQSLFNRGAINVFIEPVILKQLVQRAKEQNLIVQSDALFSK